MKKLIVAVFMLFVATFANALNVGDSIPTFEIEDQFEKKQTIASDTKIILVTAEKGMSEIIRDYLLAQPEGFLVSKKAVYVGDISGMPSLIARFFALPKMKKYPFSILLVDEEQTKSFSKKEESITVYSVENGTVSNVKYIKTAEELKAVFK
jgi:NADPH-dependent ferric siderophore reductase